MIPILFSVGHLRFYTFGIFLVLAFFWGSFWLWKNIQITSYKEEEIFDTLFFSLFGGLIFGRLTYVILHFQKFGFSFIKFILINGYPGISLYGFIAGSLLFTYIYLIFLKKSFIDIVDYAVSGMFLALAFGKLGAFFAATEVGVKANIPLVIHYVGYDGARLPVALYESVLFFIGAVISQKILYAVRRERLRSGMSFFFFLWYLSLVYSSFDIFKENKMYLFHASFNILVSLILLLTFTIYFVYYFRTEIVINLSKLRQGVIYYAKKNIRKFKKRTRIKAKRQKREVNKDN